MAPPPPPFLLPLRVSTAVVATIELGLTAYVSHWSSADYYEDPYGDWGVNFDSPAPVNFLIFTSVWSLLVLGYAMIVHVKGGRDRFTHKYDTYIVLGLDAATAVFWLAGFVALALLVGGFGVGKGGADHFVAAIEASVVFGAFLW